MVSRPSWLTQWPVKVSGSWYSVCSWALFSISMAWFTLVGAGGSWLLPQPGSNARARPTAQRLVILFFMVTLPFKVFLPARGWHCKTIRIRMYNGIPNVAAMIHRQPAPARGWLRWMLRIRTYHDSGLRRMAADCRRYSGYVHYDTVWLIRLKYRYVAGGRLPPLQYICSEIPYFQRIYYRFASVKCRKRGALP